MRPFSFVLQAAGLVAIAAGAWVLFGYGAALIAGGVSAVLAGAILEREAP